VQKLDVLIFAAHPDDAELGCGGTIVKIADSGKKIGIIDLTQGELGTRGSVNLRGKEAKKAGKILGIDVRLNVKLKDGNIQNNSTNRLKLIKLIRHFKPDIIFLPFPSDRHPDHIHTSIIVKESAFYSGLSKIRSTYNKKPQLNYRPSRLIYYMQTYTFEPSFIIDVTNEFGKKMKAVNCYNTQFYNENYKGADTFISDKKFIEFVEARAKFYGFMIGAEYGEPFYTEEKLKIDPNTLFNKKI
jgi:bacillithiol biosynthesis deacetylase BshB1